MVQIKKKIHLKDKTLPNVDYFKKDFFGVSLNIYSAANQAKLK